MIASAAVVPLPELPEEINSAAYRWPMWVAGVLGIVFVLLFVLSFVGGLRRSGLFESDVSRGVATLVFAVGALISLLAAAGLDGWTQDRLRDARDQRSADIAAIEDAVRSDIARESGAMIDEADMAIFLRSPQTDYPALATAENGDELECLLSPRGTDAIEVTCEEPATE